MLDIECFSFLNRALEGELTPLVVMASNRGMARIRGTSYKSPHGLPFDLLDRLLIVTTEPYTAEDVEQIIKIRWACACFLWAASLTTAGRCQEEDVTLTSDALTVLTTMTAQTTLRYALNIISCAQVLARKRKAEAVDVDDLRRAYAYFLDEKRSVQFLKEQQGGLVFDEIYERPNGVDTMDTA